MTRRLGTQDDEGGDSELVDVVPSHLPQCAAVARSFVQEAAGARTNKCLKLNCLDMILLLARSWVLTRSCIGLRVRQSATWSRNVLLVKNFPFLF